MLSRLTSSNSRVKISQETLIETGTTLTRRSISKKSMKKKGMSLSKAHSIDFDRMFAPKDLSK